MTPREFEASVFELEDIRIVIRAPLNEELGFYGFERKAANNSTITAWLESRVIPRVAGFPVVVINGSGDIPNGRTKLGTLRESYD